MHSTINTNVVVGTNMHTYIQEKIYIIKYQSHLALFDLVERGDRGTEIYADTILQQAFAKQASTMIKGMSWQCI